MANASEDLLIAFPFFRQCPVIQAGRANKSSGVEDVQPVPVYTTKPTACSVFLTVQPRSSRLSIPAPTFSLSGFSLRRERQPEKSFAPTDPVRYSLLLIYSNISRFFSCLDGGGRSGPESRSDRRRLIMLYYKHNKASGRIREWAVISFFFGPAAPDGVFEVGIRAVLCL